MSGGGGGGNTTSTTTTQNYSPEEAARRAQVMDAATGVYTNTKDKLVGAAYPGSAPVPFSAASVAGQNLAIQNAVNAQPTINAINSGVSYGLTDAMDVNNNPYLQQAMEAGITPITQKYMDPTGVMSQIRSGAGAAGQFGGSRQGIAEGVAAGRYLGEVGDKTAQMASDAYNKGQDTFARTLAFSPQALDTMMQPVNWLSSVGAQQENLGQSMADYDANARMWDLNKDWLPVQNYANIVFGAGSGGGTATTTGNGLTNQRSPLMGALGGAAMGYSMGGPVGAALGGLVGLLG